MIAGTPQYMSPEQASGEAVDHRSDLFSLGSVLYALCTGRPPFRADTTLAVLRRVEEDRPRPIREINPDIPDWLAAIVGRLQAKAPADRFPSAAEVAALLEGYLAHLQQPTTIPAPELLPSCAGESLGPSAPRSRVRVIPWFRRPLWRVALALLAILGPWMVFQLLGGAGETGQKKESDPEHYLPLRGHPENCPGKLIGPGATECVRLEPDGLRITLPAGRAGGGPPTGLSTGIAVKGDFEISVSFEILKEPEPGEVQPKPTALSLRAVLDRPELTVASTTRRVTPTGKTEYTAFTILKDKVTGKPMGKFSAFPTATKVGRLRVVRTGSEVASYVSDGVDADFTFLQAYPFSDEDLKDVHIVAHTGGPKASFDIRVTDLRVRAESLSNAPAAALPEPGGKRWLLITLASALAVTLALGVWLCVRQSRRAGKLPALTPVEGEPAKTEAPSPSSFACTGCGKNLKARAELAGKRVKCPQCGAAIVVPRMGESAHTAP